MSAERAPRGGWSAEADDLSLKLEKSLASMGLTVLRSNNLAEMSAQASASRDAAHYLMVLTGQCWEAPDRLRVVMELRRSSTAAALWSRSLDDTAGRRAVLAEAASQELRGAIGRFAGKRPVTEGLTRALDLHAQARRILHRGKDFLLQTGDEINTPWPLAELLEAARLLERARLEDPTLAPAHSGLAWIYRLAGEYDERMYPKSREVVEAALQVDAGSAEANFVKGYSAFFIDWDFVTAEQCLRSDIERSILHLDAYRHYVDAALLTGHADRAEAVLATARSVLPRSFQLAFPASSLANFRGNYGEVERLARETLAAKPEMVPARSQLAVALARQGKMREAEDMARRMVADNPKDLRAAASLARIFAFQGRKQEAEEAIRHSELEKRAPGVVGGIQAYCGDLRAAFRWFRQAVSQHDNSFPYIVLDPIFSRLQKEPEAAEVFRHLRLNA
jgi:tetratricopeptide (TPR) repeat protein